MQFIIKEIRDSEADFVRDLRDLVTGYLEPARQATNPPFPPPLLETIFCNLPELLGVHLELLAQLDQVFEQSSSGSTGAPFPEQGPPRAEQGPPHTEQGPPPREQGAPRAEQGATGRQVDAQRVAQVFIRLQDRFTTYSKYCTNFPLAISVLSVLRNSQKLARGAHRRRLARSAASSLGDLLPALAQHTTDHARLSSKWWYFAFHFQSSFLFPLFLSLHHATRSSDFTGVPFMKLVMYLTKDFIEL